MKTTALITFTAITATLAAPQYQYNGYPSHYKPPTQTPPKYGCVEGQMRCSGQGFVTCNFGSWVYRPCGPGTTCKQQGHNLFCDYAPGWKNNKKYYAAQSDVKEEEPKEEEHKPEEPLPEEPKEEEHKPEEPKQDYPPQPYPEYKPEGEYQPQPYPGYQPQPYPEYQPQPYPEYKPQPPAYNKNGCTEGEMRCSGQGFETCNFGSWVYRPCGPGTTCKQQGSNLFCDYAYKK